MARFAVDTSGIGDLLRDMRRISPALGRAMVAELRSIAWEVAHTARSRAPRKSGRLASSIRPSVRRGTASIYSNLEYAPVQHFGGTIKPRGTPIRIEPKPFMTSAVEDEAGNIEDKVADLLDGVALRYGGFK